MIKKRIVSLSVLGIIVATAFCFSAFMLSPPIIIYKTKADYSKYVPVTLSEDKSKVVSYPAPGDVYYKGQLAYPTSLDKGYWLDKRGVGPKSAFIKLTYEEYAKLPSAPGIDELYAMIIDKDPFTEIYDLGSRYH